MSKPADKPATVPAATDAATVTAHKKAVDVYLRGEQYLPDAFLRHAGKLAVEAKKNAAVSAAAIAEFLAKGGKITRIEPVKPDDDKSAT